MIRGLYTHRNITKEPVKREALQKKILTAIIQFVHVTTSYRGVSKMHETFKDAENYYLYRYEDFILNPEKSLIDLCCFLEIQFNPNMLNPKIFNNTSFNQRKVSRGIHRSSLEAWKTKLPGWMALLIGMVTRRSDGKVRLSMKASLETILDVQSWRKFSSSTSLSSSWQRRFLVFCSVVLRILSVGWGLGDKLRRISWRSCTESKDIR